jgi:predicted Fe-Mo cluster-binding NifX family protein
MKIAIPMDNGQLASHFGHCREFALSDVDVQKRSRLSTETIDAPAHEPGLLPKWLADRGVNLVIAGGMGQRARMLFSENGIDVITGAGSEDPNVIIDQYLADSLETGENACDH